jgi:site-specific DNA-adenine methylase
MLITPERMRGVVIYLDPPYRGVTGYDVRRKYKTVFDSDLFDESCLAWARTGNIVLVSGYESTIGTEVAKIEKTLVLNAKKGDKCETRTERIFLIK